MSFHDKPVWLLSAKEWKEFRADRLEGHAFYNWQKAFSEAIERKDEREILRLAPQYLTFMAEQDDAYEFPPPEKQPHTREEAMRAFRREEKP
jgi:hypothetical protein